MEPWGTPRGNPQGDSGALRDPRLAGHAGLALARPSLALVLKANWPQAWLANKQLVNN